MNTEQRLRNVAAARWATLIVITILGTIACIELFTIASCLSIIASPPSP